MELGNLTGREDFVRHDASREIRAIQAAKLVTLHILARVIRDNQTVKFLDLTTLQDIDVNSVKILDGATELVYNKNKPMIHLTNILNGANAIVAEKVSPYIDPYNVCKGPYCIVK